ncbi:AEC family transporter [Thalassospiraceae bacterium LMO-JJ14]|nr:AEC family transporter [Thalassospiraceae bacterium LMO-JJ14]
MGHVFAAVAPIFLIIALGVVMKAKAGFSDEFWRFVEKLTFNGLFPSLLFVKISGAHIDWGYALPIACAVVIGIHLTAAAAVPFRRLLKLGPERFVSVFQGGFRSNTYVGFAIALGVFGDEATGPMVVSVFMIAITINFLGVWGHLKWLDRPGRAKGWKAVAIDSFKNPLIQASLVGGLFNITGWGFPPIIGPTLELLSRAALPMGLMAVGAGLSIHAVRDAGVPVAFASVCKLIVQPALTYGLGVWLGLEGFALLVPVVFAALPTSSTSYVVSRQMGSDAPVAAAIVTLTHLCAIVTLPVLLALMLH